MTLSCVSLPRLKFEEVTCLSGQEQVDVTPQTIGIQPRSVEDS